VVNVRFISATNQDPVRAVEQGRLREDLFYRLGVVPIQIPPLRDRLEDIPVVASHFLEGYWLRHHGNARPAPALSDAAVRELQGRPWKGNVRELQNVIEHAIVLGEGRAEIDVADLPEPGSGSVGDFPLQGGYVGSGVPMSGYHETRDRIMARFQKEYLTWVLQAADGNVSEAARVAGVSRATMYRLLRRSGLVKDDLIE
jgi:DNA-binding NtrC family response regulator